MRDCRLEARILRSQRSDVSSNLTSPTKTFMRGVDEMESSRGSALDAGSNPAADAKFDHVWYWKPRWGGAEKNRKNMRCRVLVRGGKNSVLVEMEDGEWIVTCRYAVRKCGAVV